jgi:hypothetical protein
MRESGRTTWTRGTVLLAAVGTFIGPAAGQGMPKEGAIDVSTCWSGASNIIAFSKTHAAQSFEFTGTMRSNSPGGAFDMRAFRCVGMVNVIEGRSPGYVTCENIDRDGDKYFTQYTGEGSKYAGTVLAGTGKYEGMVATFNSETMGPFPVAKPGTFQNCSRQTGTYKLR